MSHSFEYCLGMCTNPAIKNVRRVYVGSRDDTVKQYKKSEKKWNKELKALKKQNKMLYSIAKKSVQCRESKNISSKDSKKVCHSSRNFSGNDLDSDYFLVGLRS